MLIQTSPDGLPLCPRTLGGPIDPLHEIHNRTLDAFYNNTQKDADGEMDEQVGKAYYAAAYGALTDRMDLFHESVTGIYGPGGNQVVSAWYFKCRICGLILPATAQRTT